MPTERLHICSGRSGYSVLRRLGVNLIEEGRAHAAEQRNAEAVEVDSIDEIVDLLDRLRRENARLAFMDFHTHGGAGVIRIGEETLHQYTFERRFEGYQEIFQADARIEFHGCNVANDAEGEYFLVKCGYVFLRRAGGTVAGHTGFALATRAWGFDSSTPAYFGSQLVARVSAGGTVVLDGAHFLRPHALRLQLRVLRSRDNALRTARLNPDLRDRLGQARRLLDDAENMLAGHPPYRDLLGAHYMLSQAGRTIHEATSDHVLEMGPD